MESFSGLPFTPRSASQGRGRGPAGLWNLLLEVLQKVRKVHLHGRRHGATAPTAVGSPGRSSPDPASRLQVRSRPANTHRSLPLDVRGSRGSHAGPCASRDGRGRAPNRRLGASRAPAPHWPAAAVTGPDTGIGTARGQSRSNGTPGCGSQPRRPGGLASAPSPEPREGAWPGRAHHALPAHQHPDPHGEYPPPAGGSWGRAEGCATALGASSPGSARRWLDKVGARETPPRPSGRESGFGLSSDPGTRGALARRAPPGPQRSREHRALVAPVLPVLGRPSLREGLRKPWPHMCSSHCPAQRRPVGEKVENLEGKGFVREK